MEERLKLMKASTVVKVDATLYRSIVGGLRYLVHTRPDIVFTVGYVSRFMEDPREDHWAVVKRLLRYVKGTVDHGIIFPKTSGTLMVDNQPAIALAKNPILHDQSKDIDVKFYFLRDCVDGG
ncbi:uncharacterized mitochondrial protein AtMg00810-like [Miscanthus floridulus]|uniref:uncharacterized mitochondrial protein AtMg00810-like n=1 Tax=Miscanthus floridulus TaxID=154761 RepID=UPI0034598D50